MKKRIRPVAVTLCLVSVLCLGACKETPEQDIVVNKGDNELQEIIENSSGEKLSADYFQAIKESFKNSTGEIQYNIDASFDLADAEKAVVMKVKPHYFTETEAENFARALFGDEEIYEYSEILAKSEIEAEILEIERIINDKDGLLEYYGTEQQVEAILGSFFYPRLERLKTEYECASDGVTKNLCDFKYYTDDHYHDSTWTGDGNMTIKASANVNGIPYFLWVSKREDADHKLSSAFVFPFDKQNMSHESKYFQTTELTEEDVSNAKALVQDFLERTGLSDIVIKKTQKYGGNGRYAVKIECSPEFGALSLVSNETYWTFHSDAGKYGVSEEMYTDDYVNTEIDFVVSNGRIICFTYISPMEAEVLNENVRLTDYDSVVEAVKNQLEVMWTRSRFLEMDGDIDSYAFNNCTIDAEMEITRIELNLIRTRVRNEADAYYLLPAWVVYGSYALHSITIPDRQTRELDITESLPLFAINAVDGSVINTSQGY